MTRPCRCGSKLERYELYDARGIFVSYVCESCEPAVRAKFRPDIFTDSAYWHDEPIDPED